MGYAHGIEWTNELVKKEILKIKDCLRLNRMPTRKEIEMTMNNTSLTNRISRTKGYYGWAKELGLSIKDSETTFGKQYEYKIKHLLESKGFQVNKMSQNYSFDLLINDNVKIDVKVAKPYISKDNSTYHTFNLYKKYASCDIYICVCLEDEEAKQRILIIPSKELKITQLSVGKNSIYNKYINRFDYIEKYIDFYNGLSNEVESKYEHI